MSKTYIFDLDGTLLDSLKVWEHVGNRYLRSLGIQGSQDLDEIVADMTLSEASLYMKEQYHLSQSVKEIIDGIHKQIEKQYTYEIQMKQGVLEFLQKCHQEHIRMCIFTASDLILVQKALLRLEIIYYFDKIYTCETLGYTKNQKESYLAIVKDLDCQKAECIVVEDACYAIQTAKKAGFYVKAIYDSYNKDDWNTICSIANQCYLSFEKMEV
ncbi:MAG: HAD family hydrolase [Longibaculum sp.]